MTPSIHRRSPPVSHPPQTTSCLALALARPRSDRERGEGQHERADERVPLDTAGLTSRRGELGLVFDALGSVVHVSRAARSETDSRLLARLEVTSRAADERQKEREPNPRRDLEGDEHREPDEPERDPDDPADQPDPPLLRPDVGDAHVTRDLLVVRHAPEILRAAGCGAPEKTD